MKEKLSFYLNVCIFFCVCACNSAKENFDPNAISHTTKSHLIKMIEDSNAEVLIYFYTKFEDCPMCKTHMPHFQEAAEYLEKLEDGELKCHKLAVKFPEYGVTTFPQLLLFRKSIPFRFDLLSDYSPDDIVEWVEDAKQTSLPHLDDETFEHLTQASTGSTTGDWLIMFANKDRVDCWKPNLADLASAAIRLRGRKNVAVLDVSANVATAERFGMDLNTCVKILFFHRTDLYHYKSDDRSAKALLKYVLGEYTKDEAMPVPTPHDHKNEQMADMILGLKQLLEDHAYLSGIAFIGGIGCGLLSVFALIIFIIQRFRKRKLL